MLSRPDQLSNIVIGAKITNFEQTVITNCDKIRVYNLKYVGKVFEVCKTQSF